MKSAFLFLILFAFCLLTMNFQCGKDYGPYTPPVLEHFFKEPISVLPYQTYYKTGDTIWVSLDLPTVDLFDTISNKTVTYDSAFFDLNAQMKLEYDYPYNYLGPFASFIFPDSSEGVVYDGYGPGLSYVIGNFKFGCAYSSGYKFRLGLILLKKGVFSLRFPNNQIGSCCDSCNRGYNLMNYFFDVNDTHLDFYRQVSFKNIGRSTDIDTEQLLENKIVIVFQVD